MMYRAKIMLHTGILDNAGMGVTLALKSIGFSEVENVRIGRTLDYNADSLEDAENIAKSQTNEVMEYYEVKET
jgi:phosphoribosylformylglycinamidine (FGAM) synthase PurS component